MPKSRLSRSRYGARSVHAYMSRHAHCEPTFTQNVAIIDAAFHSGGFASHFSMSLPESGTPFTSAGTDENSVSSFAISVCERLSSDLPNIASLPPVADDHVRPIE